MTTSAFKHFPDGRDTARLNANRYYLRFRTRLGDAQTVSVDIGGSLFPLEISRRDELYDYWQGEFTTAKQRLAYRFVVKYGEVSFRYPSGGPYFSQNRADFPLPDPPAWVRDAVFYQIFPDRFENGDRTNDPQDEQPWGTLPTATNRMGGDIKGMEKRLPYLKQLGINAIYLNPIFHAVSNHGYDTIDYLKVDPRFGNVGDLRALVKAAHRFGIRVVLDAVFNHSSTQFFAFLDLVEHGEKSQYRDWFFPLRFPLISAMRSGSLNTA